MIIEWWWLTAMSFKKWRNGQSSLAQSQYKKAKSNQPDPAGEAADIFSRDWKLRIHCTAHLYQSFLRARDEISLHSTTSENRPPTHPHVSLPPPGCDFSLRFHQQLVARVFHAAGQFSGSFLCIVVCWWVNLNESYHVCWGARELSVKSLLWDNYLVIEDEPSTAKADRSLGDQGPWNGPTAKVSSFALDSSDRKFDASVGPGTWISGCEVVICDTRSGYVPK